MIKELLDLSAESDRLKIVKLIEKKHGKGLVLKQDHIFIDYNDTHNYGAVIFNGEVVGFISVDFGELCLIFTATEKLLAL